MIKSFNDKQMDFIKEKITNVYGLTKTENKVFSLALMGYKNREIGDKLYITEKTVKFHLTRIFKRVPAETRQQFIWLFSLPDLVHLKELDNEYKKQNKKSPQSINLPTGEAQAH